MTNPYKKVILFFITIGIVAISFNYIFGQNTIGLITSETIPGTDLTWYRLDTYQYVKQLQIIFEEPPQLFFELPERDFVTMELATYWQDLGNNLAVILDYVISAVNVLLWPIRVGGYTARLILAIFGVDVTNFDGSIGWLTQFVYNLLNLQIDYI